MFIRKRFIKFGYHELLLVRECIGFYLWFTKDVTVNRPLDSDIEILKKIHRYLDRLIEDLYKLHT